MVIQPFQVTMVSAVMVRAETNWAQNSALRALVRSMMTPASGLTTALGKDSASTMVPTQAADFVSS